LKDILSAGLRRMQVKETQPDGVRKRDRSRPIDPAGQRSKRRCAIVAHAFFLIALLVF
jgi:hypothetical protein